MHIASMEIGKYNHKGKYVLLTNSMLKIIKIKYRSINGKNPNPLPLNLSLRHATLDHCPFVMFIINEIMRMI